MTILRSLFIVGLAFLWPSWANAEVQKLDGSPTSVEQQVLSLNFTNDGQHLAAFVGQQIEITLGTIGGPQYGEPQVSSTAIRLESTALVWPTNPGGPTFIYIFEAAAEGEAEVTIPIIYSQNPDLTRRLTFTVTIRVETADKNSTALRASMTPDQANTEPWKKASTNMHNDVRQSFVPSLPRLAGVEVELMVINPGATSDDVTMTLMNAEGVVLAHVSKAVPVDDCRHVLFLLPKGGLPVSPGQAYSIGLTSDGVVFGWKYVAGGYAKGAASWNGKPLLPNARSTFLFRTFGAN